jgi:Spy/CpxP family protein refolding chaperone
MKKKMILVGIFAFGLLASSYAYTQQDEFHGRPDCCCCCCCRPCPPPPPQHGHGGPGGMSLTSEDMIKKLELTDDQVTKLKTEEQAFKKKMEANRPDRSSMNSEKSTKSSSDEKANKPGKGGQMDTMMKEHETAIKGILNNKQYKLYQKYMQENRPQRPDGGQRSGGSENEE